jgi:hypothetical protein
MQGYEMGGLFSESKSIRMPEVEEEPPEVVTETMKGEGDKPKRRKGRAETILTGELVPTAPGKTLLG